MSFELVFNADSVGFDSPLLSVWIHYAFVVLAALVWGFVARRRFLLRRRLARKGAA